MSLYQDNNREIRYLNNTQREQKIIGNYYRDIIRQYGVDVNYYKLQIPYMEQFKTIVDENTILLHAYGYDENPDYSVSANMIAYMEVQDDLLQLDKYGVVPNTTVNFWFDRDDFACSLAQKMGQLKEYKVKETEFVMEVPEQISDAIEYEYDGETWTYSLSDDIFPYAIGFNAPETFESDILTGRFSVILEPYEVDKEYTVICNVLEHDSVNIQIPTNEYTANSFKRKITNSEFVETMLFLTYKVSKISIGDGKYKFILHGRLHGGVLFNDTFKIGKYMDKIHPDVGDVITIGFPNQNSRQQYEITECTDKKISNDGINPLLGKYVWLCKAKRRIDNDEGIPEINQDDQRLKEGLDFLDTSDEIIARKISDYDDFENDDVYGGYERPFTPYDQRKVRDDLNPKDIFIDDGSWIEIFKFQDGCMLVTNGYELFYINSKNEKYQLTTVEDETIIKQNLVASGLQYIKSTDNSLYFVNFDNRACKICEDPSITHGEIELCLNSLIDTTFDGPSDNKNGQCFYKFRESRTVLISMEDNLYCRLGNSKKQIIKLT